MAISDLLNAREFPVDRDAYRYLDRLHEALFFKNERQASHMCNLFIKHFDFDPPSDVANDLEEANKETLAKSGLSAITICGMDLSSKKKLKKLKELLSRCPEVKKIELVFCSLTNERLLELFEAMMNLKCLLFLGLRGNKLDNRVVFKLHKLLEEPGNFPALVWTDFRNNKGIITIPGAFVQLLMQRRLTFNAEKEETPDERVAISVQDAMNGKVC
ncbi:Leucine rich repeat containing 75A [Porites harrisoni]